MLLVVFLLSYSPFYSVFNRVGCAGTHSCCEFVITMTLWSPEDTASEQFFISLVLNFFLPLFSMQFPVCVWTCISMYVCVYMCSPVYMHVYMCVDAKGMWRGRRKPSLLLEIISFYLSLCQCLLLGVLIKSSLASQLALRTPFRGFIYTWATLLMTSVGSVDLNSSSFSCTASASTTEPLT